jgi:hypothetical protein
MTKQQRQERKLILKKLEELSELRGRYTMVNDFCSAAFISKTIRHFYNKLARLEGRPVYPL